jgi:hypothetical protein
MFFFIRQSLGFSLMLQYCGTNNTSDFCFSMKQVVLPLFLLKKKISVSNFYLIMNFLRKKNYDDLVIYHTITIIANFSYRRA